MDQATKNRQRTTVFKPDRLESSIQQAPIKKAYISTISEYKRFLVEFVLLVFG